MTKHHETRQAPALRGGPARLRMRLGLGTLCAGLALLPGAALAVAPMGTVQTITPDGYVKGWAYAPNVPSGSVELRFHRDSATGPLLGTAVANEYNAAAQAAGISGNRGFSFQLPLQDRDGLTHTVYTVASDPSFDEASLNMNTACTIRNGAGSEARAGGSDDAHSWGCVRRGPDTNIGGPDLWGYCSTKGTGFEPHLKGAQVAPNAANNWVCRKPQVYTLDMNVGCTRNFGSGVEGRATNPNDAYTWGCFRTTAVPETRVSDPDLNGYCSQRVGSGYAPYLNGPVIGSYASYNWVCRRSGYSDQPLIMNTACQIRNGGNAFARAGDVNNAYTWGCYNPAVPVNTRVGSPNLEAACLDRHPSATPYLDGPVTGPNAASQWKCRASLNESPLVMQTACERRDPTAQARVANVNDAYTWSCSVPSTVYTPENGPDLGGYCSSYVGSGYEPRLAGAPQGLNASSLWRCRKTRSTEQTQLGALSYTLNLPATQSETLHYVSMHLPSPGATRASGYFYPWPGRKVALQTPRANGHYNSSASSDNNPAVMAKIVEVLDAAYDWYKSATGNRTPSPANLYQGRLTFTVIEPNCGGACGRLGSTGIELSNGTYEALYKSVRDSIANPGTYPRPAFDQAVFYELGRNFWLFERALAYKDLLPGTTRGNGGSVVTGYAVAMRFYSMDAAGVDGAPFDGQPFANLRTSVHGLVDTYLANTSLNWNNTLALDQGIPGVRSGSDLFASFVMRLASAHPDRNFIEQVWQHAANQPQPSTPTTQDAVDTFIVAASLAANTNLTAVFSGWRWPAPSTAAHQKIRHLNSPDLSKYGL
ncbi:hypothetical protein ACN47A_09105 [Myxococcus fulvus]|uniref:hypothetical protein n=1 Tax=Myxococcus fulvus TaxID=33 RepID=UPI003B99BEE2